MQKESKPFRYKRRPREAMIVRAAEAEMDLGRRPRLRLVRPPMERRRLSETPKPQNVFLEPHDTAILLAILKLVPDELGFRLVDFRAIANDAEARLGQPVSVDRVVASLESFERIGTIRVRIRWASGKKAVVQVGALRKSAKLERSLR